MATAATFVLEGTSGRYRLAGVAGFATAAAVLAAGQRLFAAEPRADLDLSGVTEADGAGLAVLLTWVSEAKRAGRGLTLSGLPERLRALARVCGVEDMLGAAGGA